MGSFFGAVFGVLIAGFFSHKYLSKKDKIDCIEQSYPEGEKLYVLLWLLGDNINIDKFKDFELYLQHLCIKILSDSVPYELFKYKYHPLLKAMVDTNYLQIVHNVLKIPFEKDNYQYLYDACNWKPENMMDILGKIKQFFIV